MEDEAKLFTDVQIKNGLFTSRKNCLISRNHRGDKPVAILVMEVVYLKKELSRQIRATKKEKIN